MDYTALLATLLGGTILGSILTFLNTRRANQTTHMETVAKTLSELNDRLKADVKDLREEAKLLRAELDAERRLRRELAVELEAEKGRRHELERRVATIERRTDSG